MPKAYTWIISATPGGVFKKNGVSPTYIVPAARMNGMEKFLPGSDLWLVLRGMRHNVIGRVQVKNVERFIDGYHSGDYLLFVYLTSSFRINASDNNSPDGIQSAFNEFSLGINETPGDLDRRLKDLVRSRIEIRLGTPKNSILPTVGFEDQAGNPETRARAAVSAVVQNFPLDEIWGSGAGNKLTPFINFAYALIAHSIDLGAANECAPHLKRLDPLAFISMHDEPSVKIISSAFLKAPLVDVDFIEIDPDSIYAREFIAATPIDPRGAMDKTEVAERKHQEMLRDVVVYCKSRGISAYETTSIDLMIRTGGVMKVIEIKSATDVNLAAQCAKGSFQLARYATALKEDYKALRLVLVVHGIENKALERHCVDVLNLLGIRCLIYNPDRAWPNRVRGLFDPV